MQYVLGPVLEQQSRERCGRCALGSPVVPDENRMNPGSVIFPCLERERGTEPPEILRAITPPGRQPSGSSGDSVSSPTTKAEFDGGQVLEYLRQQSEAFMGLAAVAIAVGDHQHGRIDLGEAIGHARHPEIRTGGGEDRPRALVANIVMTVSGQLGSQAATRLPGPTPAAESRAATWAT